MLNRTRSALAVSLAALSFIVGGCASSRSTSADAVLAMPHEGFIDVEGGRVWYAVRGSGTGTPLLVLHGGPGIPHDYLENLDELGDGRPVVFYDQLGCGKSDRPEDASLWTRERFAREVGQVRGALGLDEVVLYGHSWGSILAVDYLTGLGGSEPKGVKGVILAGPALEVPRWVTDARRLLHELGEEHFRAIEEAERTGNMDSPEFQRATQLFYAAHVCRVDPWPDALNRAFEGMGQQVYGTMNGPTEFTITGTLQSIDLTPRLRELHLPVLYICGEFDEATPESTRYYASLTPNASVVVVPDASHIANYDQPEAYFDALRHWLKGIDGR